MKTASSSSVAVSFGSRAWNRMTPSSDLASARDDRQPEHEQRVRKQRAEDRRLRDDDLARGEREQNDEELGQVAERRLEHSGRRGPEVRPDRLGSDSDRPRQPAERGRARR